jgi:hypothetical protein
MAREAPSQKDLVARWREKSEDIQERVYGGRESGARSGNYGGGNNRQGSRGYREDTMYGRRVRYPEGFNPSSDTVLQWVQMGDGAMQVLSWMSGNGNTYGNEGYAYRNQGGY